MSKKKKPFALVLMLDNIDKGVYPSEEVLKASFDEIDAEHVQDIAVKLLQKLTESPQEAPKPQGRGNYQAKQNNAQEAAPVRQKPKLDEKTKPLTPAQLAASKGRASVTGKYRG